MEMFPPWDYLLMILVLAAHYPIGKWLMSGRFFTVSLVGVSLSALIGGILANRCAILIRPYLIAVTLLGAGLGLRSIIRHRSFVAERLRDFWPLALLGLLLFWMNEPLRSHFVMTPDGVQLIYNGHYTYLASQSIEMLGADYWSRLRLLNFYPSEWTRYHFFHGASQSVPQTLIRHPGLFSYFMAQVCLGIFMLLSFAEIFYYRIPRARIWERLIVVLLIGTLGFTVFRNSITFSLFGSGAFALFAFLHFSAALLSRQPLRAMIFAGIFGASAFRCLPVALVAILAVAVIYRLLPGKINWLVRAARSRVSLLVFILLFCVYNAVTYFFPGSDKEFFTRWIFYDDWQYPLTSYKLIGYFIQTFSERWGNSRFQLFNYGGILARVMPLGSWRSWLFILYTLLAAGWFLKSLYGYLGPKKMALVLAGALGFLGLSLLGSKNLFSLHLMMLPYFVVMYWAYRSLEKIHPPSGGGLRWKRAFGVLFTIQVATLLYQYTGADEIPTPVAYAVFDLGLWAVGGYLLWMLALAKRLPLVIYPAILLLPFFVAPGWKGFAKADLTDRTYRLIPMSEVLNPGTDLIKRDLYSSIRGERINLGSVDSKDIVNSRFIHR